MTANQIISVVDYGAGNIGSILNMIRKLGGEARTISTSEEVISATKLILPGVGHFDFGMKSLNESGMKEALDTAVQKHGIPILGICLGAQLMCKSSQEGNTPGLGWFDANVLSFRKEWEGRGIAMKHRSDDTTENEHPSTSGKNNRLRVPHMGWNYVDTKKECELTRLLPENPRFYFVHSYFIESDRAGDVMFETQYGNRFASGLHHENKYAVQFHPEKSHKFGLKLFENFLNL